MHNGILLVIGGELHRCLYDLRQQLIEQSLKAKGPARNGRLFYLDKGKSRVGAPSGVVEGMKTIPNTPNGRNTMRGPNYQFIALYEKAQRENRDSNWLADILGLKVERVNKTISRYRQAGLITGQLVRAAPRRKQDTAKEFTKIWNLAHRLGKTIDYVASKLGKSPETVNNYKKSLAKKGIALPRLKKRRFDTDGPMPTFHFK